jgi:hypothetical protein
MLAASTMDDEQVTFEALGECLSWVCALDQLFEDGRTGYKGRRNTDSEGRFLPGLRYARNQVLHGDAVLDVAESTFVPNAVIMRGGPDAHRMSRIVTQPTGVVWVFKSTLPALPIPSPKLEAEYATHLEAEYATHLAGQDVMTVVRGAVNWLDRTLAAPWLPG